MSMTTHFDSLEYAQRLERAGVPEDQAAVHAQVLQQALTQVVCAGQLSASEDGLRQDLRQTEARLTAKIELVRDTLDAKIERVRLELNAKIEAVRISLEGKIDVLRAEIKFMRWMMGVLLAMSTGIIIKLFNL